MAPASTPQLPPAAAESLDISFNEDALSRLCGALTQYGDAFRIYSPVTNPHIYVFSHPDHIRHMLVDNHQNYTKGIGIKRVGILSGPPPSTSNQSDSTPRKVHSAIDFAICRLRWAPRLHRRAFRNG